MEDPHDPIKGGVLMHKIMDVQGLILDSLVFECPYCGKQWRRGGHKEGFVKSAAASHVHGCRSIVLYDLGYMVVGYDMKTCLPIDEAVKRFEWAASYEQSIKRLKASRKRAHLIMRSDRFARRPIRN